MMALDLNTAHLSPGEMAAEGLVAGLLGAVAGTLGGAEARAWLARRFRRDSRAPCWRMRRPCWAPWAS
ncbi:hypothetical protein ACFQU7_14675 [Pseudoroseomonas wenyumeiae]